MNIIQVNVLTLAPSQLAYDEQAYGTVGRIGYVHNLLDGIYADLIGIQEARTKGLVVGLTPTYLTIASGATSG